MTRPSLARRLRRRLRPFLLGAALPWLLTACDLAPAYHRPATPSFPAYKEAAIGTGADGIWRPAVPADDQARGPWWRVFKDPALDRLEARIEASNPSLAAAVARYDQARALTDYARAQYFPSVDTNGDAMRERGSDRIANPHTRPTYNDYLAQGDVSYELDLWGKVRNAVRADGDKAEASAADLASTRLSLQSELATDYFSLRGDDAEQGILDSTVAAYEKALELTTNRLNGGDAAAGDVAQAQTQLETARTRDADMHLKRQQLEHAIAILLGVPPAQFSLPPAPLAGEPPVIPVTLPSELLLRRPDVASAERQAAAANANIGVARAALYPSFNLNGGGGFESATIGTLFSGPAAIWSLGPSFTFNIFDSGLREAEIARSRAAFDEAAADYRGAVVTAYREVEDNLAALVQLRQESTSQDAAVAAAGRALGQSRYRYAGGITTYLEVVTTENSALQTQLDAADIRVRRMNAAVGLIKALGGGWHTP